MSEKISSKKWPAFSPHYAPHYRGYFRILRFCCVDNDFKVSDYTPAHFLKAALGLNALRGHNDKPTYSTNLFFRSEGVVIFRCSLDMCTRRHPGYGGKIGRGSRPARPARFRRPGADTGKLRQAAPQL